LLVIGVVGVGSGPFCKEVVARWIRGNCRWKGKGKMMDRKGLSSEVGRYEDDR